MTLSTAPLTPRIGSEVRIDASDLLSGAYAAAIRALLDQRGVLLFRGVELGDDEQVVFARTLGPVHQEIYKVTFDENENERAAYQRGTISWHMDRVDLDVPPLGSILSPRILSPTGGQTEFASTYAAYEDLPEPRKRFLDQLRIVHSIKAAYREVPGLTDETLAFADTFEPKIQPLVWRHRSGRKSLAIGMSACQVVGMDQAESDKLLSELMSWSTQPQYVYRHEWRMGDLLMWDNTGTMHRVLPFDFSCGRRLHRTTLLGEESLAAA